MSSRDLAENQPESFVFTPENLEKAKAHIAKYPEGRQASAVMPLLDIAQRQEGWVTVPAINVIAELLGMPEIRVLEVATFYTMYNLKPVGKCHVQVCTSLSCWLRGSDDVLRACKDVLGLEVGQTDEAGAFTVNEVECAGACVNAPVMAMGDDYYEDLTYETACKVLESFKKGEKPAMGAQIDRQHSAPAGGLTSLTETPGPVPKQAALTGAEQAAGE